MSAETPKFAARLVLVALGPHAHFAVQRHKKPADADVERVSVGAACRYRTGRWKRTFFADAPADADFGAADLRPYRAYVEGAALVVLVASPEEGCRMRADRFVAEARTAGAITVIIALADESAIDAFGADVALGAGPDVGERLSAAIGLFVDPIVEIGIVGWDLHELRPVASNAGASRLGWGRARGARGGGRAARAARIAVDDLGDGGLATTRGVHMLIRGGEDVMMREIEEVCGVVNAAAHEDADISFAADFAGRAGEIEVRIGALGARPAKPAMPGVPLSSARELLRLLLELGRDPIDAELLARSPPRRVRFERAKALSRALGLGDLGDVWRGSFARADNFERYAELSTFATAWADRDEEIRSARVRFDHDRAECLPTDVRQLLEYRCALERARTWHDGVLAANGLGHLAVVQARRIAAAEVRRVEELDALIAHILDPLNRVIPTDRLRELGYPEGDLAQLDAEWL